MSRFDSLFATFAVPALDAGMWSDIYITPHGGTQAAARGEIVRPQADVYGPDAQINVQPLLVRIAQSSLPTVTIGADKIKVPVRTGSTDFVEYTVKEIEDQRGACWLLRLK